MHVSIPELQKLRRHEAPNSVGGRMSMDFIPPLRHWHLQDFPCNDGLDSIFLVISSIFCRTSRTTRIDLQRSPRACLKSRNDQIKRTAPTSSEETISIFCARLRNYKAHEHVTRTVARENSWEKNRVPGTIQPFCVSLCAKNFELSSHLFRERPLLRTGCCGFFASF